MYTILCLTGGLYSMTNSYDASFYFAGGLILVSAFLCYPLTKVSDWEKRKNEEKAAQALPHA